MIKNNKDVTQHYSERYVDRIVAMKENGGMQLFLPGYFFDYIAERGKTLMPKDVWKDFKQKNTPNVQPLMENFSNLVLL